MKVAAILILVVVLAASFLVANNYLSSKANLDLTPQPFYVGVTYCGNSSTGAKLLIDKVKSYTNLFVIQSGELEKNTTALVDICNYAVDSGLHFIVYFSAVPTYRQYITAFLGHAAVWGDSFLGIYFDDEPGGKMLDSQNSIYFYDNVTQSIIEKAPTFLKVNYTDGSEVEYIKDGSIEVWNSLGHLFYESNTTIINQDATSLSSAKYIIKPNGTIYQQSGNFTSQVTDSSISSKIQPYQQLLAKNPFQTYSSTAQIYVGTIQNSTSWPRSQTATKLFTSDYALYWYDYLGGFDTVFAEIGWNSSAQQQIALTRGAANLQGKEWGAIITWKYSQPPYLGNGTEMYNQMHLAYVNGAKYIVVFNYPTSPDGNQYGVLQDDQFAALQRFWNDTVKNQTVANGAVKGDVALIIRSNYGSGLRSSEDNIWGLWQADNQSKQVWGVLQSSLATYGSRLDVVYDNSVYSTVGKYQQVIYWNKTT